MPNSRSASDQIDVVAQRAPEHPMPPWLRVHVRPHVDPVLDSSVERTIVDCAEELELDEVIAMIDRAAARGALDVARLDDLIRRAPDPRATRIARTALALWQCDAELPSCSE